MSSIQLTQDAFTELKAAYAVYGTHTVQDKYRNEQTVKDDEPRGTIWTMWHPMSDAASIAEYGPDISSMYYAIVYDDPGIKRGDVIALYGEDYEVAGIKRYNTHIRVEVRRKKV